MTLVTSTANFSLMSPVPAETEFRIVLNDPTVASYFAYGSLFSNFVCILTVAPKAAAPIAVAAPTSSASSEGERPVHSLESLQSKPFPDGVVSTERELYLSNDVFNDLFKMSKDEWTKLPKWKRVTQKKKHKLF